MRDLKILMFYVMSNVQFRDLEESHVEIRAAVSSGGLG